MLQDTGIGKGSLDRPQSKEMKAQTENMNTSHLNAFAQEKKQLAE